MGKLLGIEFAPLSIPLERRIQSGVIFAYWGGFISSCFMLGYVLLAALFFTPLFFVPVIYVVWLVYDWSSPDTGGWNIRLSRRSVIWKYITGYFPIKLAKTADLDPTDNYIFACFPHGQMPLGAISNFCCEATGFSKLFPGIRPNLLTLKHTFTLPIYREWYLAAGASVASRDNMNRLLNMKQKGQALVLFPGGARESIDAVPHSMDLTLNCRKGFVKIAIQNGAQLVPVITFGDNELFKGKKRPESDPLRKFYKFTLKWLGVPFFLFLGRGLFQYTIGFMPFRGEITTIVGRPIYVEKDANPSQAVIDEVHKRYSDKLVELYNEHKQRYGYGDVPITFAN